MIKPRTKPASGRPLGSVQRCWLEAMIRHGGTWSVGCGYLWSSWGRTVKLSESLLARGLVRKVVRKNRYDLYVVTAAGRREAWRGGQHA